MLQDRWLGFLHFALLFIKFLCLFLCLLESLRRRIFISINYRLLQNRILKWTTIWKLNTSWRRWLWLDILRLKFIYAFFTVVFSTFIKSLWKLNNNFRRDNIREILPLLNIILSCLYVYICVLDYDLIVFSVFSIARLCFETWRVCSFIALLAILFELVYTTKCHRCGVRCF